MLILDQCVRIAMSTVLCQHNFSEESAGKVCNEVMHLAKQFHASTNQIATDIAVKPIEIANVMTNDELAMYYHFAFLRDMDPENLLRKCILHYVPIEIMLEHIEGREHHE